LNRVPPISLRLRRWLGSTGAPEKRYKHSKSRRTVVRWPRAEKWNFGKIFYEIRKVGILV
jgi:hypothetical protein